MKATLTFKNYEQARDFATAWSRKMLRGYTMSAAKEENPDVIVYDVTEAEREWIEKEIFIINNKGATRRC